MNEHGDKGSGPKPDEAAKVTEEEDDDTPPNPFNPIALVAIAVLVIGGWFLMDRMRSDGKMRDCVMSGRRNCGAIDEDSVMKSK